MNAPAMNFSVDELLDEGHMKDGPITVLWGQDEWVPPSRPLDYGERPKPTLLQRLLRLRLFKFDMRLLPPEDADLASWGRQVAAQVGVPWKGRPRSWRQGHPPMTFPGTRAKQAPVSHTAP